MTYELAKEQFLKAAPVIYTYIVNRLREPSTWRGLSVLLSLCGVYFNPEQWQAITGFGAVVIGLIDVLKKDSSSPDSKFNQNSNKGDGI